MEEHQQLPDTRARTIADALYLWMLAHREKVPNGSATSKALDYRLKRWAALTSYLDDGRLPIDNNRIENLIRPWALGRSNCLFAGSLARGDAPGACLQGSSSSVICAVLRRVMAVVISLRRICYLSTATKSCELLSTKCCMRLPF